MSSDSLDHLLPPADESPRCADFTRSLAVDPGGTAIAADLLVLVDTPLPWPKPVFDHPLLGAAASTMPSWLGPSRVLAVVPAEPRPASGRARVRTYWRDGATTRGLSHTASSTQLGELLASLAADHPERSPYLDAPADQDAPLDAVLICTQGSHDACCGVDGMRLCLDVTSAWPDRRVFRVSHTGGHRFAPTAMTLPDGRMWAHLDLEMVAAILARSGSTAELAGACRGWWGAPAGMAQVAERAVFAESGWSWDDLARRVALAAEVPDGAIYEVTGGTDVWEVSVARSRAVPTISCRAPGGLPVKPGQEYRVGRVLRRPR